jgi:hypothetical protein
MPDGISSPSGLPQSRVPVLMRTVSRGPVLNADSMRHQFQPLLGNALVQPYHATFDDIMTGGGAADAVIVLPRHIPVSRMDYPRYAQVQTNSLITDASHVDSACFCAVLQSSLSTSPRPCLR